MCKTRRRWSNMKQDSVSTPPISWQPSLETGWAKKLARPTLSASVKAFRLRSCVAQSIPVFVGVNIFWAKRKYHSQLFLFYLVFASFSTALTAQFYKIKSTIYQWIASSSYTWKAAGSWNNKILDYRADCRNKTCYLDLISLLLSI